MNYIRFGSLLFIIKQKVLKSTGSNGFLNIFKRNINNNYYGSQSHPGFWHSCCGNFCSVPDLA
jgi:hypothetical protein